MSEVKQRHHCGKQHPKSNVFSGLTKNILAENTFCLPQPSLDGDGGKV